MFFTETLLFSFFFIFYYNFITAYQEKNFVKNITLGPQPNFCFVYSSMSVCEWVQVEFYPIYLSSFLHYTPYTFIWMCIHMYVSFEIQQFSLSCSWSKITVIKKKKKKKKKKKLKTHKWKSCHHKFVCMSGNSLQKTSYATCFCKKQIKGMLSHHTYKHFQRMHLN